MAKAKSKGPFCQSCGMPMEKPAQFGTDKKGYHVNDYCTYCFSKGKFTNPKITKAQMLDRISPMLAQEMKITEARARTMAKSVLPKLKRWK